MKVKTIRLNIDPDIPDLARAIMKREFKKMFTKTPPLFENANAVEMSASNLRRPV